MPSRKYRVKCPDTFHCKLCNTVSAPFPQAQKNIKAILEFEKVVIQYTGSIPCTNCRSIYSLAARRELSIHNITNPDRWIIQKLIRTYNASPSRYEKKNSLFARRKRTAYKKKQRELQKKEKQCQKNQN